MPETESRGTMETRALWAQVARFLSGLSSCIFVNKSFLGEEFKAGNLLSSGNG